MRLFPICYYPVGILSAFEPARFYFVVFWFLLKIGLFWKVNICSSACGCPKKDIIPQIAELNFFRAHHSNFPAIKIPSLDRLSAPRTRQTLFAQISRLFISFCRPPQNDSWSPFYIPARSSDLSITAGSLVSLRAHCSIIHYHQRGRPCFQI